jgi:tetratricopeptide (TPR) repeat protein
MMTADLLLSGVGASAATVALLLSASRLAYRRRTTAALSLTVQWLRLPTHRAALVVATLAMASGLCFAKIADNTGASIGAAPAADDPALGQSVGAPDGEMADAADQRQQALEKLRTYADGIRAKQQMISALSGPTPARTGDTPLPDVDTMITRLAKRLETDSGNVDGWRMLGWSYLRTGKTAEAVAAYERALSLDPKSAEIKAALDEARKTTAGGAPKAPAETANAGDRQVNTLSDAVPEDADRGPMIRSMVERLAARLESAPHDADGWLRLMRARTVLGESDLAREALRKALAAFADDKTTRDSIVNAAREIGISAY